MLHRPLNETVKRKELVGKLGPLCLRAFSAAAQSAKARGNPYVELAHFLLELIRAEGSDMGLLLRAAGVDEGRLLADLNRAVDALPHGAGAVEEFSDHIFHAIREGWQMGSLDRGEDTVRSGYVLLAARQVPVLEGLLGRISPEFDQVDARALAERFDDLTEGSVEAAPVASEAKARPHTGGSRMALESYAIDLTARARAGEIDPVVGRNAEIRQIVDVLLRRRQNNPILTGEAGVGKTAVVEGLALRLAAGDVPPTLRSVELHLLDVGLMQAGASVKGEFERRLKSLIDEVRASDVPVILFIDEAHTLIGAGGAAGTGDAANLLKPPLARGELRTIAATTWAEYKEHIEKDPALTRRFQVVRVEEPSEEAAVRMCRGVAGVLERHHRVEILDEAIEASVSLSHRYIPARQLPDKAISLLDTACARVAISQHATPAAVEDAERRLSALRIEEAIVAREEAVGIDPGDRRAALAQAIGEAEAAVASAHERWEAERGLVEGILDLRAQLRRSGGPIEAEEEDATMAPEERAEALADLTARMATLAEAQGEHPLILPAVDRQAVAAVVQDWTGIPTGRMLTSQTERALRLADILAERVVGQDHAMRMIARRIQTAHAGLGAPEKPIGVFLLCGPSGVGKTETAIALAEALYGGEQNLISINMSEFQEAHTVSTLKGAPPGYVGYGKGGVLTEAVRRRPYSVVLLDEVEKAHPDVHEIFFQVFDKGVMDDSEGRRIDFKNTLILLTSNVGSDEIMARTERGRAPGDPDALAAALRAPLLRVFPAALLGRVVTIPYLPLSEAMIEAIAGHKLRAIAARLARSHGAELVMEEGAMDLIKARCTEIESGGRMIDALLTNTLLPELSRQVLTRTLGGEPLTCVTVTGEASGFTYAME